MSDPNQPPEPSSEVRILEGWQKPLKGQIQAMSSGNPAPEGVQASSAPKGADTPTASSSKE